MPLLRPEEAKKLAISLLTEGLTSSLRARGR